MAGETFLPIINLVNISEDFFSLERGVNNCLIKRLRGSMVADLACRITEFDDSSHVFIIDGDNNPANSIEDEDVFDIRILLHHFKDIFHFILVFG
jgi:hypothetical protein